MSKLFEKPFVTVSGKKCLFKSSLHQRLVQDLPQEGVDWRRRLDSVSKSVYIDVDFVDFDVDSVERASERLTRCSISNKVAGHTSSVPPTGPSGGGGDNEASVAGKQDAPDKQDACPALTGTLDVSKNEKEEPANTTNTDTSDHYHDITIDQEEEPPTDPIGARSLSPAPSKQQQQQCDISDAFFNQKLLGRPILHTYWADKADFEAENQKSQFDEWIGQVQASTCTEWAIIIIEDGDFKAQLGTALFKSKLQSSASQSSVSSAGPASSLSAAVSASSSSFLDRMKKGLSTMFQNDSNSDRWLTLVNQERGTRDNKAQESYGSFVKKLRNLVIASFSKQIELFEEQLRVQRELRVHKNWSFSSYFSMQEELAFAFEFLTLFDEALVQYDFLDALFTEYISSPNYLQKNTQDPLCNSWTSFTSWAGLCLDMNCAHSESLRRRIVQREASLLDFRNYLFAKRCDLMFMQNQPWRVAASTSAFLANCVREHGLLQIESPPGALLCWSFTSALEVLQKCECYSCTSTMENYSLHTVDIWNNARKKLIELGRLVNLMPGSRSSGSSERHQAHIEKLLAGSGPDPHNGLSYQKNDISPQVRLRDALAGGEQFAKHLIEISELTLGTYKHIGRKRHAHLVGKELAEFYVAQEKHSRALPFFVDMERTLEAEGWLLLLLDIRARISQCNSTGGQFTVAEHESADLAPSGTTTNQAPMVSQPIDPI